MTAAFNANDDAAVQRLFIADAVVSDEVSPTDGRARTPRYAGFTTTMR